MEREMLPAPAATTNCRVPGGTARSGSLLRTAAALLRRARRAAGLLALALLASLALLPPDTAQAQTNIWSATLTVDEGTVGTRTYRGCDDALIGDACATGLSDNDFTYSGTTFDVESLMRVSRSSPALQRLDFELDKAIPSAIRTNGQLTIGTTNLLFSNATFSSGNKRARWSNPGFNWTDNQSVSVSLGIAPPPTPTFGGSSVLLHVYFGDHWQRRPSGSAAWNESFAWVKSPLAALIVPGAVTCASGSTAEIGWYKSDALTTRLGTYQAMPSPSTAYLLYAEVGAAGEYRALAYCKSGTTYSTPVNLMRGGAVTITGTVTTIPGPPKFSNSSTLTSVTYNGQRYNPGGNGAWSEDYKFRSGFDLIGEISPGTVTCEQGSTLEIGWYRRNILRSYAHKMSRLGTYRLASGSTTFYHLDYRNVPPGHYAALAWCMRGAVHSVPVNLMRGSGWTKEGRGPTDDERRGGTVEIYAELTLSIPGLPNTGAIINEGASQSMVTGTLSQALSEDVEIGLRVKRQGTDENVGTDKVTIIPITITAGQTTGTGTITAVHDSDNNHEYLYVRAIAKPSTAVRRVSSQWPSAFLLRIRDDEAGAGGLADNATAQVTLSAAPDPVAEGSPVTVTATLSRALPASVTIPLAVTDVTAEGTDHGTLPSIEIAAGDTTGTSAMTTAIDLDGDDETFRVGLDTANLPSMVTAGEAASDTVTITDTTTGTAAPLPAQFPKPPAVVQAYPGNGEVVLTWSEVTGLGIGWEVKQGDEGTWTATGGTARTHTVTGLTNGNSYTFYVRATSFRGAIKGDASAGVTETAGAPAKPDAVASVNVAHNGTSLGVSWDAPARATHYDVAWSGDGGNTWTDAASNRAGTGLTVTGTASGTAYTVRVRARNAGGQAAWTSSAAVSYAAPAAVASVNVTHNGSSLAVEWDAPAGAAHYHVTYSGDGGQSWQIATPKQTGTGLTIGGVDAGTSYTVGVRAGNAAGWSGWTNSAAGAPSGAPDAVAEVRVTHKGNKLAVEWDAPARATHYDVTYSGGGVTGRAAWNRAGTDLEIACDIRSTHEGQNCIAGGTGYTVSVRARNAAGESAWTNSAEEPGPQTAPDAVAEVRVTHKGGKLAVEWDAPARATHYDVTYYRHDNGQNARAAWNRAGTDVEITCDSREGYGSQHCVTGGATYTVGVRARNASGESAWTNSAAASGPALAVADATVSEPSEGSTANLAFTVTLDPASSEQVTVDYATSDGTAAAGSDYTATSGTLTFAAGETSKTVSVPVLADGHDDGGETLTLTLSNASGARITDAAATGTITNDGHIPKAWTARFGRTVADQVIGAVESRMQAGRVPGAEVSLAGERIGLGPLFGGGGAAFGTGEARMKASGAEAARAAWLRVGPDARGRAFGAQAGPANRWRSMGGREFLLGSSFALTSETGAGGSASFWGRGAVTRFDGREGETSLDGEVATGMLGADWSGGRTTAGLIVGHSMGEGGYKGASGGGAVSSTLTGLYPWGRYAVSERVTLWGVAGWGEGRLTLEPENGEGARQAKMRADLDLMMGSLGLRGTLLDGGADGFTLTGKTDAMAVRTSTGRGKGADGGTLASARATVTRLRLGLEARRPMALGGNEGATLTPSLEVGVRQDGGDAESGFGVDLGGGIAFSGPGLGLEAELRGRGLLTHEAGGFRERGLSGALHWRQQPGTDRGARLSLTQTVGRAASGGADALLSRTTLEGLAANDNGSGTGDDLRARRLEVKLGYGLSAFSGRFTLTPEAGAGFADTGRDYRVGLRLAPAAGAAAFELSLEAVRREAGNYDGGSGAGAAEHEVGFTLNMRF